MTNQLLENFTASGTIIMITVRWEEKIDATCFTMQWNKSGLGAIQQA